MSAEERNAAEELRALLRTCPYEWMTEDLHKRFMRLTEQCGGFDAAIGHVISLLANPIAVVPGDVACWNRSRDSFTPCYSLVRIASVNPLQFHKCYDVVAGRLMEWDTKLLRRPAVMTRVTPANAATVLRHVVHPTNVNSSFQRDEIRFEVYNKTITYEAYEQGLRSSCLQVLAPFRNVARLRWDRAATFARAAGRMIAMHNRLKEIAYAPGGEGDEAGEARVSRVRLRHVEAWGLV